MPTYEYECQSCGHLFELFQTMTAKPIKECPACHKNKAKRLISAGGGVIFKGSGFYATDYKKPRKRQEDAPTKCAEAGKKPECSSCPARAKKDD